MPRCAQTVTFPRSCDLPAGGSDEVWFDEAGNQEVYERERCARAGDVAAPHQAIVMAVPHDEQRKDHANQRCKQRDEQHDDRRHDEIE